MGISRPAGTVVLILTILFCLNCKNIETSEWSPESSDLLFISNSDGNSEIYLIHAGSTEWINLTNNPANDNWPQWSPDGKRIAFQSTRAGNDKLDIWVMDADGSNPIQLTDHPDHDYLPSWTPDGKKITFSSWRSEPGDNERANHTYIMNADGSDQRRFLSKSPGTSAGVVWLLDGKKFLQTRRSGENDAQIFVSDNDGENDRQLTSIEAYNGAPAISSDGMRVAFYSDSNNTSKLAVINLDGTNLQFPIDKGNNWYPRWSPDGRWLVYTAATQGSNQKDLDVMAIKLVEGAEPVKLAGGPGREAEGTWRPQP